MSGVFGFKSHVCAHRLLWKVANRPVVLLCRIGHRGFRARCRVEKSLLWEITGSLAAAGNDSRVGKQLLFSKPKIVVKQTVFNRAHTKDPRPTSSIQR